MIKRIVVLALFSVVVFGPGTILAAEKKAVKPWKRFDVNLGASRILNQSSVRVGSPGLGVDIDPESALGLDSTTTTFRLDGFWRFTRNRRHRLDFTYYSNRRHSNKTLEEDLEIGDDVIDVGTEIDTKFNFDLFRLGYSWSFFQDDRVDLGVGGGLYIVPIELKIDAEGTVNGQPISPGSTVVEETLSAPLPVINLRADIAITPRWFLRNRIDAFYLEINEYTGSIIDTRVAVEYEPFKHVGFGLAWDYLRLDIEAEDDDNGIPGLDFTGNFEFRNAGLMLYLKAYF